MTILKEGKNYGLLAETELLFGLNTSITMKLGNGSELMAMRIGNLMKTV